MHGHLSIKYACRKPILETNLKQKEVQVCIGLAEGGKGMYFFVLYQRHWRNFSPRKGMEGGKRG